MLCCLLLLPNLQGICEGMVQALAKTSAQLADMGQQARALFESDRTEFVDNMRDVAELLRSLLQVAEAAAGIEGHT